MYRVELKDLCHPCDVVIDQPVPNVPCGVESSKENNTNITPTQFLMYRVELKVYISP